MSDKFAILEWDDWWDSFEPIPNPSGDGENIYFETHGRDLARVQEEYKRNPRKVWTVVDADGIDVIVSGLASINKLNYLITKRPLQEDVLVEVIDPDDLVDEEYDFEPASNYVEKA